MAKQLNVGIIGYGFMGRTHSNAYRKVTNFFDVPYAARPARPSAGWRRRRRKPLPTNGAISRTRPTGAR